MRLALCCAAQFLGIRPEVLQEARYVGVFPWPAVPDASLDQDEATDERDVKAGLTEVHQELSWQLPALHSVSGLTEGQPAPPSAAPPRAQAQAAAAQAQGVVRAQALPSVVLHTSAGDVRLRVRTDQAPKSGGEFLELVKRGVYNGCTFYRAESFVVQGGLRTPDGQVRENPLGPIATETALPNVKGSLAFARWPNQPATGEFFVNMQDNLSFNGDPAQPGGGFGVFAEVADGMDVVERISRLPVHQGPGMHLLNDPVVIETASVV